MPAYSFQSRFVPFVKDGSKTHTIRNRRRYPAKIGSTCYLYSGLRTKWCQKIGTGVCVKTFSIAIYQYGVVFYPRLLEDTELEAARISPFDPLLPIAQVLSIQECDRLAWADGFRPDGSTSQNPGGAFNLMIRFWNQTHSLPWAGDIIYWQP